ncbi:MAG: hypothetical protein BA864_05145 [Desulfuromonadales bacterium C00003093]|nr:MAG: hypothetical protein BA864_05145 [Desulfuromonadales bacterium C00003093]
MSPSLQAAEEYSPRHLKKLTLFLLFLTAPRQALINIYVQIIFKKTSIASSIFIVGAHENC